MPFDRIEQVRIHYLLEGVKYQNSGVYDPTELITFVDRIIGFGLKPGFEIMGNPGDRFTDFSDHGNLTEWYHLVAMLVGEFQNRYGPELGPFFDRTNWTNFGQKFYQLLTKTKLDQFLTDKKKLKIS